MGVGSQVGRTPRLSSSGAASDTAATLPMMSADITAAPEATPFQNVRRLISGFMVNPFGPAFAAQPPVKLRAALAVRPRPDGVQIERHGISPR